jgi:arylsulfatase A-like enzyme
VQGKGGAVSVENVDEAGSPARDLVARGPGLVSVLILTSWCGLIAGLLEVGAIGVRKWFDPNRFSMMSRDFVWLIPVTNLLVFVVLGLVGWLVIWAWPRRGRWLLTRGLCALTIWPMLLAGAPRIFSLAWLVVVLGVASRVVPILERYAYQMARLVRLSLPVAVAVGVLLGAWPRIGDWKKQAREVGRSLPPGGSPNVLLVVMDTVSAEHLGLQGYPRPTSNTLVELAGRGIRFDAAQSTCSWTLPSHASMFTGRWFHEISSGWLTPLDGTYPTLAEYLGDRGYATSAFTANYTYCARDSGLARGFTHFEDHFFPELTCFKMSALVNRVLEGIQAIEDFLEGPLEFAQFRPYLKYLWHLMDTDRKDAAVVNRQFIDWLSTRRQPDRPFFTFLNYYDAHYPYQLTPGRMHRFGAVATDNATRDLIERWPLLDKTALSPNELAFGIDSYDECVADLDEQLGVLFDELERRGILERTWLIVTADHGESFGEHAGIFCHGMSLYQTEVHVPLLIVPPGGIAARRVVKETVSLRNLAATVVDVLGMTGGSPFPGDSLARFWKEGSPAQDPAGASGGQALAEVVPLESLNGDPSALLKKRWPLGGLAAGGWSYIRREGEVHEELFDLRTDPKEQNNRVHDQTARAALDRMRDQLRGLTGGPLTPYRFQY